jgi:hypothetical protein
MKIAEVSEKYGLSVDTHAQKESVDSINIRRELCKKQN